MWFSNLICYRFKQDISYDQESFEKALEQDKFRPCGGQDLSTFGWTKALGKHGQMLSHFSQSSILVCAKREEKVLYVGNVEKVYAVENQAGIPLHEQITNLRSSDIGELAYPPILIYPDGKIVHPHHGSWLTTQYYLPPLTMVYIPFDEFETSQMDKDIVALLAQRKPTSSKN